MDSANQIQSLVEQVEKNPEYKISEKEAQGFLSEIRRSIKLDIYFNSYPIKYK